MQRGSPWTWSQALLSTEDPIMEQAREPLFKDLLKGASLPNRAHLPLSHHTTQAVSPIWPAEFQMASKSVVDRDCYLSMSVLTLLLVSTL